MKQRGREFRFHLKIGNTTFAVFREVWVETAIEAIDDRKGADDASMRKLSGLRKYSNITLKRGYTTSSELTQWWSSILHSVAKRQRRDVVIRVLDETGTTEKARFAIAKAWPVKVTASELNAKGNEVTIETLELAHEGLDRVK